MKPSNKSSADFGAKLDKIVAEMQRPIVLQESSGEWISSREAKSMVEEICSIVSHDAIEAICRRAVIIIPIMALTWSRYENPHDYIDRASYFHEKEDDFSHFSRTISRNAFSEITGFFEVLESEKSSVDLPNIEYANWNTGDFKLTVERDFSDVTMTVIGLRFDKVALLKAFTNDLQPVPFQQSERAASKRGRPPSPAWPEWIAELVAYIHEQGFPAGEGSQGQETLITAIADRLADRGLESPSRATVQAAVRSVLDRLRSVKG